MTRTALMRALLHQDSERRLKDLTHESGNFPLYILPCGVLVIRRARVLRIPQNRDPDLEK